MENLTYWEKQTSPLYKDLEWNFPEKKTGKINLVGGNSFGFSTEIKIAEFLSSRYPVEELRLVFPDALQKKLPPLPNLFFAPSTSSGSFKKSLELNSEFEKADFNLLLGDFSKNSETSVAILEAIKSAPSVPTLLARDSVDLISADAETILDRENLTIFASLVQLQKLFRSVFYPKMILLSSPLVPVLESLHKFTLTYPVSILTFHEQKIITARNGKIITTDLEKTEYSPLSLWDGRLAGKTAAFSLYNPNKPLESINAALF
ncbi:hypothetical protein IJH66_01420 [Candidatus Saccharibacteria bacterium]|nr:hypothetical protein [Candidatus Saccharibacteria bacterium]